MLIRLKNIRDRRNKHLDDLNRFGCGDPQDLAKRYVEPNGQPFNPSDFDEDQPILDYSSPVFKMLRDFFGRDHIVHGDGRSQLFILADAGMGKSSLLVMTKLISIVQFWPKKDTFEILKLGDDTLKQIENIQARRNTILLLDGLDEDPNAWPDVKYRLLQILCATENFRRVVISCRTQFFPMDDDSPVRPLEIRVGGYTCPVIYPSYFDQEQIGTYLEKIIPGKAANSLAERETAGKVVPSSSSNSKKGHTQQIVN